MNFISLEKDAVAEALNSLYEDTKPQWGTFNARHMLEHLSDVFFISNTKISLPILTPKEHLEKSQAFAMSDKPMPQNYKVEFVKTVEGKFRNPSFKAAKSELLEQIELFHQTYAKQPDLRVDHPIFGNCDYKLWSNIQSKHISHHFVQFGIWEY